MLIHTVFFWLRPDLSENEKDAFRRGVESLGTIKWIEKAYIGVPANVPDRPVVDKSFAVGLTVICRDVAAHDAYQADPIHLAFIERFRTTWTRVQVYDYE